jgi:hypothetical protein
LYENNNTTGSTPPSSGGTTMLAATTGGITYLNNNKNPLTIGSLFRGGATTTMPTTTTNTRSGNYGKWCINDPVQIISDNICTKFLSLCQLCWYNKNTQCFCLLSLLNAMRRHCPKRQKVPGMHCYLLTFVSFIFSGTVSLVFLHLNSTQATLIICLV